MVAVSYALSQAASGCASGNNPGSGGNVGLGGGGSGAGGSGPSTTASTTTSSAGGSGGTGGTEVGGAGGTGGTAGGTTSANGGGGSAPGKLVVLAAGDASALGASYDVTTGVWTPTTLTETSTDRVGIAFDGNGLACGALRSTTEAQQVRFFLWNDAGNGMWSASAQVGTNETLTGPAMSGGSGLIDLVFQGNIGAGLNKFYYVARSATWAVTADAVNGDTNQSFSPAAAAVTRLGSKVEIAYAGQDGTLHTVEGTTGAWTDSPQAMGGTTVALTPSITALAGSPDLMIVYVVNDATPSNQLLKFMTRPSPAMAFSAPVTINAGAYSDEAPNLVGLPNGDAVVVYRGHDTHQGYFSRYHATSWSAPTAISSATITSAPSIVPGIGNADAEIVYVDSSTGAAVHARLTGASIATNPIGGAGLTHAAIASQP